MKLLFLILPITIMAQNTMHVNVSTNQIGAEYFFQESMSLELSYYENEPLATLNYNLWANKDFSVQAKWGMNMDSNVTGGIGVYAQVIPYLNIGAMVMRTFREKSRNTLGIGASVDIFQVW